MKFPSNEYTPLVILSWLYISLIFNNVFRSTAMTSLSKAIFLAASAAIFNVADQMGPRFSHSFEHQTRRCIHIYDGNSFYTTSTDSTFFRQAFYMDEIINYYLEIA